MTTTAPPADSAHPSPEATRSPGTSSGSAARTSSDSAARTSSSTSSRKERDVPVPAWFDMHDYMSGIGAHAAGPANVILQLSWPEVGYGVMNSRVHDGAATKRPFKRGRTTFTYLAVALLGTAEERTAFRKEVNKQHAQVYNREGEPVEYRGMDPDLQLWVAACLYYGTVDFYERMHGPLSDEVADALYAHCARFGASLQVPADAWPADRAAFAAYWEAGIARSRIDPPVAEYLLGLVRFKNFPRIFHPLGRGMLFVTTGFLPQPIRDQMSLPWNDRMQRKFDRRMRMLGRVEDKLPRALRLFPFNLYLSDLRTRRRLGRPLP